MSKKVEILRLYKTILANAKVFPSIKVTVINLLDLLKGDLAIHKLIQRDKIYEEIRLKFREDKNLTDVAKIETSIKLANESLAQLSQYSDLRNQKGNWKIDLSKNPMPKPKAQLKSLFVFGKYCNYCTYCFNS